MHTDDNQNQRWVAILLLIFLAVTYKQTVLDPYMFGRPDLKQAPPPKGNTDSPIPAKFPLPTAAGQPTTARIQAPDSPVLAEEVVQVRTGLLQTDISLLGGRATELKLRNFRESIDKDSPKLNLIRNFEDEPRPLGVYSGSVHDTGVQYTITNAQQLPLRTEGDRRYLDVAPNSQQSLVLEGNLPDGRAIQKTLTFYGLGYVIDVAVQLSAPAENFAPLALEWTAVIPPDDPSITDRFAGSGLVWFNGEKAGRESFDSVSSTPVSEQSLAWISLTDKYFAISLMGSGQPRAGVRLKSGNLYAMRLVGGDVQGLFRVFVGPKSYSLLESLGNRMELNVNLGWTTLISRPLLQLLHLLFSFLGNYGVAIVVLTILVKLILTPLTFTSFRQMKSMQDIAPEVKRIREQITDKQQQQMALMELYKTEGVNPVGGCLPMLLQLPIFIGLYTALQLDVALRHSPFGFWIEDLSAAERLNIFGLGIPVMVLLFVVSMVIQQHITPSTADPVQKRIMMIMPVFLGALFWTFPSGLTLYCLTNNTISLVQMQCLHKGMNQRSAIGVTLFAGFCVFLFSFVFAHVGT